jgi:hypothetical protein
MKVGFLYIGLASGAGWSYAHELARQEAEKVRQQDRNHLCRERGRERRRARDP